MSAPDPRARRLLGFFPHPDDESWAAGGTLARAAAAGVEVRVLSATRGEAGAVHPASPVAAAGDVAALRTAELRAACAALGVAPPRCLDLPDGRLAAVPEDEVVPRLRAILTEWRPQVVVTLGRDGAYGHHDHLACTRWMEAAVAGTGARLLHCAFPPGLLGPVRRALRRTGLVDGRVPLGVTAPDLVVDVSPVRDRKLAAVAAHRSQLPGGDPRAFLRPGLLDALLDREAFARVAGPPLPRGAADPFAGL